MQELEDVDVKFRYAHQVVEDQLRHLSLQHGKTPRLAHKGKAASFYKHCRDVRPLPYRTQQVNMLLWAWREWQLVEVGSSQALVSTSICKRHAVLRFLLPKMVTSTPELDICNF